MSQHDVVQSHLEVLMEELLQVEELVVDPDGDIGVREEGAAWWARTRTNGRPHIEVFSIVVHGVDSDPGLLESLNAVNRRLSHCRVFHVGDQIVVSGEVVGETCAIEDLRCLSTEVAQTCREHGPALVRAFGGSTQAPSGGQEETP